jgi:hypothetical protein
MGLASTWLGLIIRVDTHNSNNSNNSNNSIVLQLTMWTLCVCSLSSLARAP